MLEHKAAGGEQPQSYANGDHAHTADKKADQTVQKRPGVEDNSGEYSGDTGTNTGDGSASTNTASDIDSSSSNGGGVENSNISSGSGGAYLSNLLPRSTDYGGGGGGYPYGYAGYGIPNQYLPQYLPPLGSYLPLAQNQLAEAADRQDKPKKKKKKTKGKSSFLKGYFPCDVKFCARRRNHRQRINICL
jgi:hypothetical protein